MGAQHMLVVHIKGVVHSARRMVFGNIECGEIVEIGFDFGAVCHLESYGTEQRFNAAQCARYRMQTACAQTAPGEGYIERFCLKLGLQRMRLNRLAPLFKRLFQAIFRLVNAAACRRALFRR